MPGELRFDGKVVVVTGAGAGLGRAYALLFASRGASVVVNDLGSGRHGDGSNNNTADIVVNEIRSNGGKAIANYDSVLDGANIIKTAIDTFGRIDVVVNNAGILRDKSFSKMTNADWDLIQDVHVKGAFKTSQAAWPYFCKQKYGKIILTASNSGLYGNFGQANYSTAKMGLVGLSNTLSIEGKKHNVFTNVIVPTAGSRLTEDIVPPDFFNELKPELIAPIVFWLCHEECDENGSIIESALGWAGKCHIIRSSGRILRPNNMSAVTPESVQQNWSEITDMSSATRFESIQEVTGELLNIVEKLKEGKNISTEKDQVFLHSYNHRDTILYALGVGATIKNSNDLCYLYENHENFDVLPTFYALYGPMGVMTLPILQDAVPNLQLDPTRLLHGEQYLEIFNPLPVEGKVETRFKVQDVLDKGKGAVILIQHETFDSNSGQKLSTGQMSAFLVGAGGFKGSRTSSSEIPTVNPPNRKPDTTVVQNTSVDQAALYRLSGDYNPLHIDGNIATLAGYKQPILHGLCSLGFAVRHVLQTYADGDTKLFKAVKARFTKPIIPGQSLRTDMWRNGNRIHFQTCIEETKAPIITGAYVDLLSVKMANLKANPCSSQVDLESDAIFQAISDYIAVNPDQVKSVNAVFLYNIMKDKEVAKQWTLDLKNGKVYTGKPESGKPEATLTVDDKDMVQIALGQLNPQVAFMRGKLKIAGNIMLAQKLKTLMETSKAKL